MRTIGRFLIAVVTAPIVLIAYGLLWVLLIGLGAEDNGMFYSNLPFIAAGWITTLTAFPWLMRLTDSIDRWMENQARTPYKK